MTFFQELIYLNCFIKMFTQVKNELSQGTVVTEESGNYRCCGIRYEKWVLTSGLILCPYVLPEDFKLNEQDWSFGDNIDKSDGKEFNSPEIDLNCLAKKIKKKRFKILSVGNETYLNRKTSSSLSFVENKEMSVVNSCIGRSVGIFRSNLIDDYVSNNFSDWNLCTASEQYEDASSDFIQCLLSVFLLLEMDCGEINDDCKMPLNYFLKLCNYRNNVFRGLDIIVESTPFTIPQFYNSWSKGVISNNIGNMDCLFFTDARLVVGCVGSPVYTYKQHLKGELIGMILNPMLWSQGEWAGFSVAVNLPVVLPELLNYKSPIYNNHRSFTQDLTAVKTIDSMDKSVVLVRCGHNWGSGVVVNAKLGIIITCAHVIKYGEEENVQIECGNYKTIANVVYSSKVGEVFDIAVLSTEPLLKLKDIPFAKEPAVKGEPVFCVGFPMVDTDRVTVSKGVVANVMPDILIQTTCCVQSGASGGAIIRPSGLLIGIPVSNMSCATTRALFPHCNLAIPSTAFSVTLTSYFKTKDVDYLKNLSSRNPLAIQKWSFENKCKL